MIFFVLLAQMFFINRGRVEVVSEDGEVVFATMNEGKFFGEISLVFSVPRTASIRYYPIHPHRTQTHKHTNTHTKGLLQTATSLS